MKSVVRRSRYVHADETGGTAGAGGGAGTGGGSGRAGTGGGADTAW